MKYNLDSKSLAITAYHFLNEYVGDLVVASKLSKDAKKNEVEANKHNTSAKQRIRIVNKIADSWIAITLYKFLELFQDIKDNDLLPKKLRTKYKSLYSKIKFYKIEDLRNTIVAHNINKKLKRPYTVNEKVKFLKSVDSNSSFWKWLEFECIPLIEELRKEILSHYKLEADKIHSEEKFEINSIETSLSKPTNRS